MGTSQINSLASSGFTEQHATIERAPVKSKHLQQSSKQQRRQPTSTTVARPLQSAANQ
jgi:hypothetical protein